MFFLWYNIDTFKGKNFFFKSVIFLLLLIITQLVVFLCLYIYNKKKHSHSYHNYRPKVKYLSRRTFVRFFLCLITGTNRRGQIGETNLLYYRQRSCMGICAGRRTRSSSNPQYFYYITTGGFCQEELHNFFKKIFLILLDFLGKK